ncbi:MAG: glycosyltransferase [Acidobacteriota bacterium]|nr:glycosyltransferase [Acidobacteriota bacterium]
MAAWIIQALKDSHRLALACWDPPDFAAVNRAYGTTISDEDVTVVAVSPMWRSVARLLPVSAALLRWSAVVRLARRLAPGFDVVVSAENEANLGRDIIQYVHYPRQLRPRPAADLRWYHRPRFVLAGYYALCDRLTGFSLDGVRRNRTLANSAWTADRIRELDGHVAVAVLPPPVAAAPEGLPWERRDNAFLCLGRFAAEKEIEKVVAIIEGVRALAPDVELHLIGGRGPERSYYEGIKALARQHEWLHLHENLTRAALLELIGRTRYGIHGMRDEHFGMAAAEMVEGGCITFVPDSGGQVEIVGGDARLVYASPDEAVAKIGAVLANAQLQDGLRAMLRQRQGAFSVDRFMAVIRDTVDSRPHRP